METDNFNRLEKGRRRARRTMACVSFYFMILTTFAMLGALLLHPSRESIANALGTVSMLLGSIYFFFTSIVAAYLGLSAAESVTVKRASMKSVSQQQGSGMGFPFGNPYSSEAAYAEAAAAESVTVKRESSPSGKRPEKKEVDPSEGEGA